MAIKKKGRKNNSAETFYIALAAIIAVAVVIVMIIFGGAERAVDDKDDTTDSNESSIDSGDVTDEDSIGNDSASDSAKDETNDITSDSLTETETETETEAPPEQTIPVGIYKKNGKKCYLITEYKSEWPKDDDDPLWDIDTWTYNTPNLICDVAYFAVFTSQEEEIDFTYWDETWGEGWENCGLDDSYKIGFEFTAYLYNGRTVSATVLGPEDTFALQEYFELYLYDCVAHAHDSWYSHINENTNYDDTKNVMVKVTLRDGCYDVAFIELTAFVYKSADEFDADGRYIGANKASCIIEREA